MGTLKLRVRAVVALVALHVVASQAGATGTSAQNATGTAASAPSSASNDMALVSQIAAHLAKAKGVRTRFTQTQTLAAMKAPLVSTGSLLFFRERGAIWHIDTPYKATWVMTDAGIVSVDAAGTQTASRSAQGARAAGGISKMMRAMLAGDLSALYSQFDVEATGTPARWQMRLVPNQPQIAQSIASLQMSGGDYLRTLRIAHANGDVTQLDFEGSAAVSELTPAEHALFGAR
ncbi:outer membrane lipoprotein carrier protein LolA [Paraburkholderia kururiensis]|uniref:Outer membrane lipoprotein carrier protein LolA n=1 Tax=Paraburkholderia kururiensis TaxID=984307 RepID=A0ABZ0WQT0_9BURK|nr:outer membrane lipoprotein carrier protein LolA [Paraburkholderia kururiensis]WQD79769.1 outer membrane lipoprotein carrier protein LolA [Paraburkholderia kururiensis]